jgi:hypothetical protein
MNRADWWEKAKAETMKLKALLVAVPCAWLASSAFGAIVNAPWAPDTGNNGEQNLYSILGYANNAALNSAVLNQSGGAATDWSVATSDAAHYSSLILEMAGNANNNEFGIYQTGNTANRLTVFTGPSNPDLSSAKQLIVQTVMGDTKIYLNSLSGSFIDIGADTSFGFYLDTHTGFGTWYSKISQNSDGMQHVVALDVMGTKYGQSPYPTAGQSGYIMGWEDLPNSSSDHDYQDMVVSLTALPIPEPTTVVAGALLLIPFGASTLRMVRRKNIAA